MEKYIVELNNIDKSFGKVHALKKGMFNLKKSEIHSLIGENGAGKSTMMKILYGVYTPDSGEILIKGKKYDSIANSKIAIEMGIGMVHQEFMLVKELTVLENIILGFEPTLKGGRINFEEARAKVKKFTTDYGLEVHLDEKVQNISVGEAQRVEIIKTLYKGAKILILDEPTAVLTPQETLKLFGILNRLKNDGKSIIFISHKLNELMEISDRITVMRKGAYIDTVDKKDTSIRDLAKKMVGRDVFLNIAKKESNPGKTVLELKKIYVPGEREHSKIRDLSLDVKAGEILGIAGVDGNGQSELIEAITGLRKIESGKVLLNDDEIQNKSPLKIRQLGISHIPEDRNRRGLNKGFSIRDNIISFLFRDKKYSKGIVMNEKEISKYAQNLVQKYDIQPLNSEIDVANLSGGNAQKVICAREMEAEFDLIIAAQPTRGVDIGAIESIRKVINDIKTKGKAVLLVSADLQEILSLSDRIAVMYEGKITGILNSEDATEENVGMLMTGGKIDE